MGQGKEMLLQIGRNELEIVEFKIEDKFFGINVNKVKEIIRYCFITVTPGEHPCLQGAFKPRDKSIPVIDLPRYFNLMPSQSIEKDHFLISSFDMKTFAVRVNSVLGIRRIARNQIQNNQIQNIYGEYSKSANAITGTIKLEDRIVSIVDVDKIIQDIKPIVNEKYYESRSQVQREYETQLMAKEKLSFY